MSNQDDGGSAFPQIESQQVGERGEYHVDVYSTGGMTLRDYAAIKFAAAILANQQHHEYLHEHGGRNRIALDAADSYIKERAK